MPSIFTGSPIGAVALVKGSKTASFSLIGVTPKTPSKKAIVTAFSWQDGVNVQFTHTMGDDVYMNVFGNRMGTLTIDGVAFNSVARTGGNCDSDPHGIVSIIDWYKDNRASTREASILVKIGGSASVSGYLVSANYITNNAEHWMVNYKLQVATVPRS